MADPTGQRPMHLRELTDEQVDLYHRMIEQVSATGVDYWTTLRGLHAPASDKYAVAAALHAPVEAREYARQAGIDITHTFLTDEGELTTREVRMVDLRVGDRFVVDGVYREGRGVGNAVYEVAADCASHPRGWLFVRDLGREHVWDDRARGWSDEGFFSYSPDTHMHLVVDVPAPASKAAAQTAAPRAFRGLDMSVSPAGVSPPSAAPPAWPAPAPQRRSR